MYPDAYEVGLPNQGVQILYEVLNERARRARRAHLLGVAGPRGADARARHRRSSPSTRTARSPPSTCSASASRPSSATRTCSPRSISPASRCTPPTATRRTRSWSPAGTPRSTPSRSPTSSTRPCSATASRPSARSPTSSASGSAGRPRRPRRAAAAAGRDRRRLRPALLRRELPPRTAGSPTLRRTATACRERVTKHTVMNLDEWPYPKTPLVPLAETVHERMSVEIFRGCTRGCRFCQAGMITRPVRERSIDGIGEMVANGLARDRLRRGRPAVAVQRRPFRDRRAGQAARRPVRGRAGQPVAAVHPGRRVQHRPGQRVLAATAGAPG